MGRNAPTYSAFSPNHHHYHQSYYYSHYHSHRLQIHLIPKVPMIIFLTNDTPFFRITLTLIFKFSVGSHYLRFEVTKPIIMVTKIFQSPIIITRIFIIDGLLTFNFLITKLSMFFAILECIIKFISLDK